LSKPKAYVIGEQGNYRNPLLLTSVSEHFEVVEKNGFVSWELLKIDELVNQRAFRDVIGKIPMPGEIACFVAHSQAWKWLAESQEDFLAVFEDDVLLIGNQLSFYLNHLPTLRGNWQLSLELRSRDELFSHALHSRPAILRSRIQPRGAAAYIISKQAARALLKEMQRVNGIDGLADNSLTQTEVVDFYICLPPVFAISPDSRSIIGKEAESRQLLYPRKGHDVGFIAGLFKLFAFMLQNQSCKRSVLTYFKVRYLKAFKYAASKHYWNKLFKFTRA
jgi:GR25 family glycosyltransferase involved in LPS biosynthesis